MIDGKITLEILIDRGSVEVYANHGRAFLSWPQYLFEPDRLDLSMTATGGEAKVDSLEFWPISSIWPDLSAEKEIEVCGKKGLRYDAKHARQDSNLQPAD